MIGNERKKIAIKNVYLIFTVCISQYQLVRSHKYASSLGSIRCSPARIPPRTYLQSHSRYYLFVLFINTFQCQWSKNVSSTLVSVYICDRVVWTLYSLYIAIVYLEFRSQHSPERSQNWEESSFWGGKQLWHSWVCT